MALVLVVLVSGMDAHLWALLRRLRTAGFSILGRNPFGFSAKYFDELHTMQTIQRAHANPPRRVRDHAELTLWRTLVGDLWAPRRADEHFLGMLIVETLLNVYRYSGRGGEVIFDCGGNIGMFTRHALQTYPTLVVAFEPCAENIPAFRRNLEDEIASGTVRLYETGVWNERTELYLKHTPTANPGSPSVSETPEAYTSVVKLITLDEVAQELKLQRVDFIKMDIEGAEVQALSGARETIQRFRPRIAVGTEHTDDIYLNNRNVMATMSAVDSRYKHVVTEVHAEHSASGGWMLVPHSLVLEPN